MRFMNYSLLFIGFLGSLSYSHASLELIEAGKLHVGTGGKLKPFMILQSDGSFDGIEYRLMKEIAHRLGLELVPVISTWDSLIPGLLADKYDMISECMDITPDRQKKVAFANGWLESGGVVVVRKDSNINDLEDLKSAVLGVLHTSTWEKEASRYSPKEIKYYKGELQALMDLSIGRVDAVITDSINARQFIKETKNDLRILDPMILKVQKGWALKPGKPVLLNAVNRVFDEIVTDGTYEEITGKFLGFNPFPSHQIKTLETYLEK